MEHQQSAKSGDVSATGPGRGAFLVAILLAAALFVAPLFAHQQKEAITQVFFNARTGNIEVMHRFLLHDAEHATRQLYGGDFDLLGSSEARERFESYVHERFTLKDQDGAALALSPVGHEVEGRYLWVYAEVPIPDGLTALTIAHDALRDVWPEQVNLVNVERDKQVRSATFGKGSQEATIRF